MQRDKWLLTIKFDSLEVQVDRDPELTFPNDEVSQVVGKITKWSGCLVEELPEFVEFTETFIKVTFDTLQNLDQLMTFILNETVPRTLALTQE